MDNQTRKEWKKIREIARHVFGRFYSVVVDLVISPGGEQVPYSVIRQLPYSVVIPITPDGKLVLVEEHRYTKGRLCIEFPSGGSEGESLLETAKRELEEETGYQSVRWRSFWGLEESTGIADINLEIFIAYDLVKIENPKKDLLDHDGIKVLLRTPKEVDEMIDRKQIREGVTIAAFYLGLRKGIYSLS